MLLLKKIVAVLVLTIASTMALTACVTTIDDQTYSEVSMITVKTPEGRVEQLFRQEIDRLIKPQGDARYDLSAKITSSRGDNSMAMSINYTVYDQTKGEIIINKSISSSVSIGAVSSEFGEEQAFIHAEERLSINLAQKIYQRLLVFFSQQQQQS